MSLMVTAGLSDLAPYQQLFMETALPIGRIEPFPADAPVDWQILQIWNSGSLHPGEPSYSPSGFAIGDTAGRQFPTQVNAGPSFLSLTLPLSGFWGNPGLVGLRSGAVPSSTTLTLTDGQDAAIDINLVGSVPNAPESGTTALVGIGLLGIAWKLRRSRRRQAISQIGLGSRQPSRHNALWPVGGGWLKAQEKASSGKFVGGGAL